MTDSDKEQGATKPNQDTAEKNAASDHRYLRQIARRIRKGISWPYRWWRGGDHHRRSANATVLLALGTIILALVNVGMLIEMRRSADQQHTDTLAALGKTDASIAALNDQATIMRGQLDEMRSASHLAQRAFVTVRLQADSGNKNDKGVITFTLTPIFGNSGKTPALNIKAAIVTPDNEWVFRSIPSIIAVERGDWPVHLRKDNKLEESFEFDMKAPSDPEVIFTWPTIHQSEFFATIGTPTYLGADTTYRATPFWLLSNEPRNIGFYFGSIHYDDFFGDAHITKVCFLIDSNVIINGQRIVYMQPCSHWNCMDDSCTKDAQQYEIDAAAVTARNAVREEQMRTLMERTAPLQSPSPTPDK